MRAYIFDTETTDKRNGEIIEAAWLRFADDPIGVYDEEYSQRFKPLKPSTMGALAVHHILPIELEECPPSSTFVLPADCEYLIGHSIDFDWEAAGTRRKSNESAPMLWRKHVWPDATGYSQTALIYMLLGPHVRRAIWLRPRTAR